MSQATLDLDMPARNDVPLLAEQPQVYQLSIVVPTRNERDNIVPLLTAMRAALRGMVAEVIFVDDSDDDTVAIIQQAMRDFGSVALGITLVHRPKGPLRNGGLATAVAWGMQQARADYVAVMDADLQHPPELLRQLYTTAKEQDADIVIATRYTAGGGYAGLDGVSRRVYSIGLKWMAKLAFPDQLLRVSDPLGGFFVLRTRLLEGVTLRPIGYKISLEVLIRTSWTKLVEVPYHFRKRTTGTSKSDFRQGVQVVQHMLRLFKEVPSAGRFWKFCAVGASGVFVNLALFAVLAHLHLPIWLCWLGGTEASLISNFALNSWLTWCDTLDDTNVLQRLGRYHMAMVGSLLINVLLFTGAYFWLHREVAAQLLGITGSLLTSYWLARRWVFTQEYQRAHARTWLGRLLQILAVVAAAILISREQLGAWIVIGAAVFGASLVLTQGVHIRPAIIMLLTLVTGVAAIDYITWRFGVTNWSNWWIAVPLVLAEAFGVIHTVGLQVTIWPWPETQITPEEDPTQRPIFIFIPVVNEGVAVVGPTVSAARVARERYLRVFPHGRVTIVICNDGRVAGVPDWDRMERLAKWLGVQCITRESGGGAKAGNIEHGRQQVGATGDALIVIFDADQVARPDFLLTMITPFTDPNVGWVQSGQYYGNRDNPVSAWAHDQQALFYQILCPGKAALNAAFICGTNVMVRAAALDSIGGLPQNSVTEDFAASIALHPRWRSIFIPGELATGLGPLDMPAYLKQQRRWASGTLGVLRTHWRAIVLPQRNGLTLAQRFQYFLACTHYLCGLRDLIYIIAPVLFLLTGIPAVRGSTLDSYLWHFLPYWLASLLTFWFIGRGITSLRGVVMGFGSFPVLLESLFSVALRRNITFTVTAKQRIASRDWRHLSIHCGAVVLCLFGLLLARILPGRQPASVGISVMWLLYALCMLGSFFWLALRDMGWFGALHAPRQRVAPERPRLAFGWQALMVGMLLIVTLAGVRFARHAQAAAQPDAYILTTLQPPRFGLALPEGELRTQPDVITADLSTSVGIIGRTQTIQDAFDRAWADRLVAQHAYPWITLQFGQFAANGQPPLDASLTAIANGAHDDDLRRWAMSLRAYGHPVLLTILLHVDRNWALSSAVAHGGIPADAPRAWLHVQSIFHSIGATNVAWVWSPADPAHDEPYAPPADTISAVLVSLISYPDTAWADPTAMLAAVRHRYPRMPLLLEVSADGAPQAKARWLGQVGQAVAQANGIYALIYHEGTPDAHETPTADHAWSLASDPASLATMRTVVQHLTKESQR